MLHEVRKLFDEFVAIQQKLLHEYDGKPVTSKEVREEMADELNKRLIPWKDNPLLDGVNKTLLACSVVLTPNPLSIGVTPSDELLTVFKELSNRKV